MFKKIIISALLISSAALFSQTNDGYWDNIRITNETIKLKAGEKKVIKSAELPVGTTEFVYRISLLDDNQKIANSLVSILKTIPDPTGISQGVAGAVFLQSAISGDDKCKYFLFSNQKNAENHLKNNAAKNACFEQKNPISKEAQLIKVDNLGCVKDENRNIWFVFESDNWVLSEKIVLEIVTWVNTKASRGWNELAKKDVLTLSRNLATTKFLANSDLFCAAILEKTEAKYTYKEFKNLLATEKNLFFNNQTKLVVNELGIQKEVRESQVANAQKFIESNNFQAAIDLYKNEIINIKNTYSEDYNSLGNLYLQTKQFQKALQILKEGEKLDNSNLAIQLNLAHCYLFTNQVALAKKIHEKYKDQNISTTQSWIAQTKLDLENFETKEFSNENFKKILRILE